MSVAINMIEIKSIRRLCLGAVVAVSALMTGCASIKPMAFGSAPEAVKAVGNQPVYLMTVTVKHPYKTYYLPTMNVVLVQRGDGKLEGDRMPFGIDDLAKDEKNTDAEGNRYFLRLPLEANKQHLVNSIQFMAMKFPLVGNFILPLNAELATAAPGVYYLGHVDASIRERKDNEFRAGPVIPLIDQAAAGASSGTWEVQISDRWAVDEAEFKKRFPVLGTTEVRKSILPPFDRARAQREWEKQ
jgi:hypothetical protein